jgi:hypothetical protein
MQLPSLASFGWWVRSVEVVVTVLLFSRLPRLQGGSFPGSPFWSVFVTVVAKIVFLALARFLFIKGGSGLGLGGLEASRNLWVDGVTYVAPILQRILEIAAGLLVAGHLRALRDG